MPVWDGDVIDIIGNVGYPTIEDLQMQKTSANKDTDIKSLYNTRNIFLLLAVSNAVICKEQYSLDI